MPIATIEEGLEEIRGGRMVILVDEDAPDSNGFFCLAAEKVTAESINYMMHQGRGIIYVTLTDERIRELGIPMIPEENSPLAGLLAQLQAQAGPELRNVRAHQRTWGQLRVARRMAEVSAPVPEHLGPLNNQVLASRALQQLQALAPDYLQRLLTQLDTLAALAPLQAADAPADKPARRSGAARRR